MDILKENYEILINDTNSDEKTTAATKILEGMKKWDRSCLSCLVDNYTFRQTLNILEMYTKNVLTC